MIKNFLALVLLLSITSTQASEILRIVIPYQAGGGTELTARRFQKFLAEKKNINSIIEYKPGAEGVTGTIEISKAANNGTVIGITATPAVVDASQKGYDTEHISMLEIPTLLLVSTKFKTFSEFEKQQNIKFGVGSNPQKKYVEQLISLTKKTDSIVASYKGGAPVLNDLLGGFIDVAFLPAPLVTSYLESNRLNLLGSASNITSLKTVMLPKKYNHWVDYSGYCLVMPKDTHPVVQHYWEQIAIDYLKDPEVRNEIISSLNNVPPAGSIFLNKNLTHLVK